MLGGPFGHRQAILDGSREFAFRRQPVVGNDDDGARGRRKVPAGAVVGVQAALNETPAVVVDEYRQRGIRAYRRVEPHGHLAGRPGNRPVFDVLHGTRWLPEEIDHPLELRTGELRAGFPDRLGTQRVDRVANELRIRVEDEPVLMQAPPRVQK